MSTPVETPMTRLVGLLSVLAFKLENRDLDLNQLEWFLELSYKEREQIISPSDSKNKQLFFDETKTLHIGNTFFIARKLLVTSQNSLVMEQLGQKIEICEADIDAMIARQQNGNSGFLSTYRCGNVFFVRDGKGRLEAMSVRWVKNPLYAKKDSAWRKGFRRPLNKGLRWPAGAQIICPK